MTIKVTGADGAYIYLSGGRLAYAADAQAITYKEAQDLAIDIVRVMAQRSPRWGHDLLLFCVEVVDEADADRIAVEGS